MGWKVTTQSAEAVEETLYVNTWNEASDEIARQIATQDPSFTYNGAVAAILKARGDADPRLGLTVENLGRLYTLTHWRGEAGQ